MGKIVLISNPDDETMYNELYGFSEWYSRTFNLISFKLEKGVNLNVNQLTHYFNKAFSFQDVNYDLKNSHIDVTAYMVRRGKNTYQIYIPNKYVFQEFCKDVLLETWYRVSLYQNLPFSDRCRVETREAGELYEEVRKWIKENASEEDCVDSPYIDRFGGDTYQGKTILRTLNGELANRVATTWTAKIDTAQKKCSETETSWMRSTYSETYISLEIMKKEFKKEDDNND